MDMENTEQEQKKISLNVNEIKECLPHRYPMLLVDRIEDLVLGESAVGIKNVTVNLLLLSF